MTAILGAFPNKSARICDRWGQSPFIILKYGSPSHKFWRAVSKPWAGRGPLSYVLRILIKFLARVLEAQGSLCENPVFCFPDRRLVSCKETGRANSSGKRTQVFWPGFSKHKVIVRERAHCSAFRIGVLFLAKRLEERIVNENVIKFLDRVLEAQGCLCESPLFCLPDRRAVSCEQFGRANR